MYAIVDMAFMINGGLVIHDTGGTDSGFCCNDCHGQYLATRPDCRRIGHECIRMHHRFDVKSECGKLLLQRQPVTTAGSTYRHQSVHTLSGGDSPGPSR